MSRFHVEVGSLDGRTGDTIEIEATSAAAAKVIALDQISAHDSWRVFRVFELVDGDEAPPVVEDLAANPPESDADR